VPDEPVEILGRRTKVHQKLCHLLPYLFSQCLEDFRHLSPKAHLIIRRNVKSQVKSHIKQSRVRTSENKSTGRVISAPGLLVTRVERQ
jgi:hypothetical protein